MRFWCRMWYSSMEMWLLLCIYRLVHIQNQAGYTNMAFKRSSQAAYSFSESVLIINNFLTAAI